MVEEIKQLKEAVKEKKLVFGIRECLKNSGNIARVYIAADERQETDGIVKNSGAECIRLEVGREDISKILEISFQCEVFSVLNAQKSSIKMQKISEPRAKGIKKVKN